MLTTTEAALYLEERGFTVKSHRQKGVTGSPKADTLKQWCVAGKLPGAYRIGTGNRATWMIPQEALDALLTPLAPP